MKKQRGIRSTKYVKDGSPHLTTSNKSPDIPRYLFFYLCERGSGEERSCMGNDHAESGSPHLTTPHHYRATDFGTFKRSNGVDSGQVEKFRERSCLHWCVQWPVYYSLARRSSGTGEGGDVERSCAAVCMPS